MERSHCKQNAVEDSSSSLSFTISTSLLFIVEQIFYRFKLYLILNT
jgi:hypothetical protein